MSEVEYVTAEDMQAIIDRITAKYPWFVDYPIKCHESCARWDIADEYGSEAGAAFEEYGNAMFLIGRRVGKRVGNE